MKKVVPYLTYLGLRPGEKLYEELLVKTEELDKTTKKFIISISCYHFMVSQKMHLQKRSLGHGSMTSLDLGLNVI